MQDPTPLYYKVAKEIQNWLTGGKYRVGELIPPEPELQKKFGVSRLTIREAVQQLVDQGMLRKCQGRGTFVVRPEGSHRKGFLYSPAEEILARSHALSTDVVVVQQLRADASVAAKLRCRVGEPIVFLKRLRYADGIPAQLISSYLPHDRVPGLESIDFRERFLYKTLEEEYGFKLKEADEVIEATKVDKVDAELLQLKVGQPVLLTKRWTYLTDGTTIEYNEIRYTPNVLTYSIRLEGREQSRIIHRESNS